MGDSDYVIFYTQKEIPKEITDKLTLAPDEDIDEISQEVNLDYCTVYKVNKMSLEDIKQMTLCIKDNHFFSAYITREEKVIMKIIY